MKNNTLKILALILASVMLLSAVPFAAAVCEAGCLDEDANGLCDTCGDAITQEEPCDHSLTTTYTANNNGTHTVETSACECGEKAAARMDADCTDEDENGVCDVCGGQIPEEGACTHAQETYYMPGEEGGTHTVETTSCECGLRPATSVPERCRDGNGDRECDLCGETIPDDVDVCTHPVRPLTVVVIANNNGTHVRQGICPTCNAVVATRDENCRDLDGTGTCYDCSAKIPEVNYAIHCVEDGMKSSAESEVVSFALSGVETDDIIWEVTASGSASPTLGTVVSDGKTATVDVYRGNERGVAKLAVKASWAGGSATGTFCISFYTRSSATVQLKDNVKSLTFMAKGQFAKVGRASGDTIKDYSLYSFLTDGCATSIRLYENNKANADVGVITYNTTGSTGQYKTDGYNEYSIAKLGSLVFTPVGTGTYVLNYELFETVGQSKLVTSTGTLNIIVGKVASEGNEIVYNTENGKAVTLKVSDFTDYWKAHVSSGTSNYVKFVINSDTEGLLYINTSKRGTVTSDYKFKIKYEYAQDGTYPLEGVTYMPNPNKSDYVDYIDFVIYSTSNKIFTGTLKFVVGKQAAASGSFTDVAASAWYADAVAYVSENGIMGGTSDSKFEPNTKLSRAMVATVLYRIAGSPSVTPTGVFTDVQDSNAWYYNAVCWAAANGIVKGTSDTTFSPDAFITRQDLAVMLHRFAKEYQKKDVSVGENTNILSYDDALTISEYAYAALQWAAGAGIVNGADGKLNPTGSATRAEAAAMFQRYMTNG